VPIARAETASPAPVRPAALLRAGHARRAPIARAETASLAPVKPAVARVSPELRAARVMDQARASQG
jgi:hypothetical protein